MIDHSAIFAQHFSRLVLLASRQPSVPAPRGDGEREEFEFSARSAAALLTGGVTALGVRDWRLTVNGVPIPEALSGVPDLSLAARFVGHSLTEIRFEAYTADEELMAAARAIGTEPVVGDRGRNLTSLFQKLALRQVRVAVAGTLSPDAPPSMAATDLEEMRRRFSTPRPDSRAAMGIVGVDSVGVGPRFPTPGESGAFVGRGIDAGLGIDPAQAVNPPAERRGGGSPASLPPNATISEILETAVQGGKLGRVLDDLVREAETAAIKGDTGKVYDIMHTIVAREEVARAGDARTAYVVGLKRLTKRALLLALARHLSAHRDLEDQILTVYSRLGEDAAALLVEELADSQQRFERRALFDILAKLKAGHVALLQSLSDPRWYVARNAADLLGHIQPDGAANDLAKLFYHEDDRVRRAAVGAMGQLSSIQGTIEPLIRALTDESAAVRAAAAGGLGTRRSTKSLDALIERLDKEDDESVQGAILDALGRNGSPAAVNKLVEAAEPGGLFKRKTVAYRCAATSALRNVESPAARTALEKLRKDKEQQVRSAAGLQ